MKNKSRLNRVLLIILSFLVVATIFLQIIKPSTTFKHVDDFFYTSTSYLRHTLIEKPIHSLRLFMSDLTSAHTLRRENDYYRRYLLQMEQMATQIEQTYRDNEDLKNLLKLNQTMVEYDLINTTIINRDQTLFNQYVTIDVGRKDGLSEKMAVMSPKGLIGTIETIHDSSSIVKLMTNEDGLNKYSVLIQVDASKTINAILERYDSNTNTYEVRLLDSSVSINEGMKVITSGLSEIIPAGLLIGTIETIEERSTVLSVVAHIKPAADFQDLRYLSVVVRGPFNDY